MLLCLTGMKLGPGPRLRGKTSSGLPEKLQGIQSKDTRMHSKFATRASWSCWDLGSEGCFLCSAQPHASLTAPNCSSATPKFIPKDYSDSVSVAVPPVCACPQTQLVVAARPSTALSPPSSFPKPHLAQAPQRRFSPQEGSNAEL